MNRLITKTGLFLVMIALFLFASCSKNYEVSSVALNKSSVSFTIGQTDSLIATVTANGDLNKFPVTWTTTDPTVITVVKGKIVGVSKGTATITAKAGGVTTTCSVIVTDEINPVTTKGILVYFGDSLSQGVSNLYEVGIAGPVDTVYLFVNAPLTATDSLPTGDYKVLTSINYTSDLVSFSIIPGYLYNSYNYFSWYFGRYTTNSITDGDFNITGLKSGIYTINYSFIDGYGNTIYGTYESSLKYYDESASTSSSAPALKGVSNSKTTKLTPKRFNLIKIK